MERVERVQGGGGQVGQREGVAVLLQGLGLPPGAVLVLGMVLHVLGTDALGLIDKRPLFGLSQKLPFRSQPLGNLRVVHLWVVLGNLPSLQSGPDHEGVHWPLDVVILLGSGSHGSGVVQTHAGVAQVLLLLLLLSAQMGVLRGRGGHGGHGGEAGAGEAAVEAGGGGHAREHGGHAAGGRGHLLLLLLLLLQGRGAVGRHDSHGTLEWSYVFAIGGA